MNINFSENKAWRLPLENRNEVIKVADNSSRENKGGLEAVPFARSLKEKIYSVNAVPPHRTLSTREECSRLAREVLSKPELADTLVSDYAHESLGIVVFSVAEFPILRLVATGEIYTPEMKAEYDSIWKEWQAGRVSLHKNELAKGTPAVQILEKLWQYNDTLPVEFLRRAGWSSDSF
jgi:hypothetical protein